MRARLGDKYFPAKIIEMQVNKTDPLKNNYYIHFGHVWNGRRACDVGEPSYGYVDDGGRYSSVPSGFGRCGDGLEDSWIGD